MLRERTFVRRGKTVPVQEVMDVFALRSRSRRNPAGHEDSLSRLPSPLERIQLQPFQQAGWVFLPRDPTARPQPGQRARVFVGSEGRLVLGGGTLQVGLEGDPTDQEANAILAPFGGRVLERFGFAPGLFRVAVAEDATCDALDVAEELLGCERVRFAEPEWIEAIGPR